MLPARGRACSLTRLVGVGERAGCRERAAGESIRGVLAFELDGVNTPLPVIGRDFWTAEPDEGNFGGEGDAPLVVARDIVLFFALGTKPRFDADAGASLPFGTART